MQKQYLVVGASSGIGKALAELLGAQGAAVYGTYCTRAMDQTPQISIWHLDVREEVLDLSFLPEHLDGVVYCPGAITLLPFGRIKPLEFNESFELQVTGAVKVLQEVMPRLQKSERASVVLFSTVAVQTGFRFHAQVSASKGAIEGMTRALAAEYAPGIRFNAIAPSITRTPLAARLLNTEDKININAQRHPMKKIGEPADIAAMAAFLLSDQASWITGQVLAVDGGISSINI